MEHIEQKKSTEEQLKGDQWMDMYYFLKVLAPDLYRKYQLQNHPNYQGADDDNIKLKLLKIRVFAIQMVRYATDSTDSTAFIPYSREVLINPDTEKPFTIEDTGVSREKCIGTTSGIQGREKQVAEITIAMYRKIHQHKNITVPYGKEQDNRANFFKK